MTIALVVGSGPNGLAAAVHLAEAGVRVTVCEAQDTIGGGARSTRTDDGVLFDHCSAVHPMAVGSPALAGLEAHGLRWARADVDCAHPLPDGDAVLLRTSVHDTADGLGTDGPRWRALLDAGSTHYPELQRDLLGPILHRPRHPVRLSRFGLPALLPAAALARLFRDPRTRALWSGVAAHAMRPHTEPLSSAIGLGLLTAGHHAGWPVAVGGSRSITDALADRLRHLGGQIETAAPIHRAEQTRDADIVIWAIHPVAVADALGNRLPDRVHTGYRRFRRGIPVVKIDYVVTDGIPWRNPALARAGTVHLGGTATQIQSGAQAVHRGQLPEHPFVLLTQQSVADPTRSSPGRHPVSAYLHLPAGWNGATAGTEQLLTDTIERYAPGFSSRIGNRFITRSSDFRAANDAIRDGDILHGAKTPSQLVFGARLRTPYATGLQGHYLASASVPPGPGAHGMSGWHAADHALHDRERW